MLRTMYRCCKEKFCLGHSWELTITGKLKSQLGKSDASSDFECKHYNIYYIEQVTGLLSESKMILFTIWSHFFNILPKV